MITLSVIDSGQNCCWYPLGDIDSMGNVHVSYYDRENSTLKYATQKQNGQWSISIVDSSDYFGVGEHCSLAIDSNDKVHISYTSRNITNNPTNSILKYANNVNGEWVLINVTNFEEGVNSVWGEIALDSENKVHISFMQSDNVKTELRYTNNFGGKWTNYFVAEVGYPSELGLAVGNDKSVHISYFESEGTELRYSYSNIGFSFDADETMDSDGDGIEDDLDL